MKPESRFIQAVNKLLPYTHKEKMANPYRGGGADMWYSGNLGDLWIEYKYTEKLPKQVLPNLSALQRQWLRNRQVEGRSVAVILGFGLGRETRGIIYTGGMWDVPLDIKSAREQSQDKHDIARWIFSKTGRGGHSCLALPAPSKLHIGSFSPPSSSAG